MTRSIAMILALALSIRTVAHADTAADLQRARQFVAAGSWAEAASLLEPITKAEPANGLAWSMLGNARHQQARYADARVAYEKAAALSFAPFLTAYNLACVLARQGELANAYTWLEKAFTSGFRDVEQMNRDEDLAALRADAGYSAFLAKIERIAHPCWADEYRALDFWLGEWNVRDTRAGHRVGESRIELILDKCVVLENWSGALGGHGKSFNTLDKTTGSWRQTWTDNSGSIYDFAGEPRPASMIFRRNVARSGGGSSVIRMTLSKLASGEIRQLSERSDDEGKTWSIVYDFTYARKEN